MSAITAAWSRVSGRGKKTLPADLKRITHSEVLDIPKELLTPVIEASNNDEDRPEIMKHVRECLAEPSGKHWRRIYGGLVLAEALVKNGSPALITETAEGRHFDLVQRLSFLEEFHNEDKRVMTNVRRKAEALRKEVVPLIQNASNGENEDIKDTGSTCSPGDAPSIASTAAPSTVSCSSTGFGSDDINNIPRVEVADPSKRTMILNNIVAVGHNDDTTSESDGGEDKSRAPVQYREQKKLTRRERNEQSRLGYASSSDDESKAPLPPREPAAQTSAPMVDLLDL